jgi:hypothetical protein
MGIGSASEWLRGIVIEMKIFQTYLLGRTLEDHELKHPGGRINATLESNGRQVTSPKIRSHGDRLLPPSVGSRGLAPV